MFCAAHPAGSGFGVTSSSVARYVFDLADWDAQPLDRAARRVRRPGERRTSPTSRRAWAAGELVPMWFTVAAVDAHAESTTRLTPA